MLYCTSNTDPRKSIGKYLGPYSTKYSRASTVFLHFSEHMPTCCEGSETVFGSAGPKDPPLRVEALEFKL